MKEATTAGESEGSADLPTRSARRPSWLVDSAIICGLVLLAFAIRWPDYLYLPVFTDETWDAIRSKAIAEGRLQTAVNSSIYISSLQNYLTAGLFLLLGPQVGVPRLLLLLVGSITAACAYLLGREWGGRLGGIIAATLLAASAVHVLVGSHVAWSNCLTPFFTTLAAWQLVRAVRGPDTRALLCSAAAFALALMTHPATLVILPGCAIYLAWRAPSLLRPRALLSPTIVVLLICSPIVLYNLLGLHDPASLAERLRGSHPLGRSIDSGTTSGIGSLDFAEQVRRQHADGRPMSTALYIDNLRDFALLFARTAAGVAETREAIQEHLLDPVVILWAALIVAVPVLMARRGEWLPLLVTLSTLAVVPLWSLNTFEPVTNGRFMLPTTIVLFAALGALLSAMAQRRGLWLGAAVAAPAVGLVLLQLLELGRYYDSRPADNRSVIDAAYRIESERRGGEVVLLDRHLNDRRLGYGAVQLNRALEMIFIIRDIPFAQIEAEPEELRQILALRPEALVVLDRSSVTRLSEQLQLTQLTVIRPRQARSERQRDNVPSWRDSTLAAVLRRLDPQGSPERRDSRDCLDCPDPAVYRITRRA